MGGRRGGRRGRAARRGVCPAQRTARTEPRAPVARGDRVSRTNAATLLSRCGVLSGNLIRLLSGLGGGASRRACSSARGSSVAVGPSWDLLNRGSTSSPFTRFPLLSPAPAFFTHVLSLRFARGLSPGAGVGWRKGGPALSCTCCDLVSLTNQDVGKAAPWEVSLRRRERGLPGACLVLVPHRGDPAVKWGAGLRIP